jgi:adenylate cyclase, class 2
VSLINIEIKAHCPSPERVRKYLQDHPAYFAGTDYQRDTYFNTLHGRLKLREGNIENNLIFYDRSNEAGPKKSEFILTPVTDARALRESLIKAIGIKVVVEKKREIYFIGPVKFHIDEVPGLGHFVEIEASNKTEPLPANELEKLCRFYIQALSIEPEHLLTSSYSDMLLAKQ